MLKRLTRLAVFLSVSWYVAVLSPKAFAQDASGVPDAPREMRGVWIATVANIDWPSSKGLSPDDQKLEMVSLLDRFAEMNLNTVFLQVRSNCDALYVSQLEPWSSCVTGAQGTGPNPEYDPLKFACDEAHKRGIVVYAWLNPFRASTSTATPVAPTHISKTKPELVKKYGTKLWLDPGKEEARQHSLAVIKDVATRYDIDGVVYDDYFYPYAEKGPDGRVLTFPDEDSYATYKEQGGSLGLEDWRRENVNTFVNASYDELHAIKPSMVFGIGPFGIWRPGNPPGVSGMDSFKEIYADSKKWLNEGWVDFMAPQLYWTTDSNQSYPLLLKWWVSENTKGRMMWASNFTSKANAGGAWSADEIVKQVHATREQPGATGNVHYSARPLRDNDDNIVGKLLGSVYSGDALPPKFKWLDSEAPKPPTAKANVDGGTVTVTFDNAPEDVFVHTVYTRKKGQWHMTIVPGTETTYKVPGDGGMPEIVAVKAVDRLANESAAVAVYAPVKAAGNGE